MGIIRTILNNCCFPPSASPALQLQQQQLLLCDVILAVCAQVALGVDTEITACFTCPKREVWAAEKGEQCGGEDLGQHF